MDAKEFDYKVVDTIAKYDLADLPIITRAMMVIIDDEERVRELVNATDGIVDPILEKVDAVTANDAECLMILSSIAFAFAAGTLEIADDCPGGIDAVRKIALNAVMKGGKE
jgi:hypothetical protein